MDTICGDTCRLHSVTMLRAKPDVARQEKFYWAAGEGDIAQVERLITSGGIRINDEHGKVCR